MNIDEILAAIRGEDAEKTLMEIEGSKTVDPRILAAVSERLKDRNLKVRYYAQKILDLARNSGEEAAILADLTEAMAREDLDASIRLLPSISSLETRGAIEILRRLNTLFPSCLEVSRRLASLLAGCGNYRDAAMALPGNTGKRITSEGRQIQLMRSGLHLLCGEWKKALESLPAAGESGDAEVSVSRIYALLGCGSLDAGAAEFMNSAVMIRDWMDGLASGDLASVVPPEPEACRGKFSLTGDPSILAELMNASIEWLRGRDLSGRAFSSSEAAGVFRRFQNSPKATYFVAAALLSTGCASGEILRECTELLAKRTDVLTRGHDSDETPDASPSDPWEGCPIQGPFGLIEFGARTIELMLAGGSCERALALASKLSSISLSCRLKPSESSLISEAFASIASAAPMGSGIREAAVLGRIKSLRLSGDLKGALEAARKNLSPSANPSNLIEQIGKISLMTGDLAGAKQAFLDLYRRDGKLKHAKVLAQICIDSRELDEAIDYLSILSYCSWDKLAGFIISSLAHLFETYPGHPGVGKMLAKSLSRTGDQAGVARVVRAVASHDPSDSTLEWIESMSRETGSRIERLLLDGCDNFGDLYDAVKVAARMPSKEGAAVADEIMELSRRMLKGKEIPSELNSDTDEIFFAAGKESLDRGNWTEGAGFFQKVSGTDPYLKARALHLCARCFFEANLKALALTQISKISFAGLAHLRKESLALRYDTALLLKKWGDLEGAAALLSTILADDVGYRDTLAIYEELGRGNP